MNSSFYKTPEHFQENENRFHRKGNSSGLFFDSAPIRLEMRENRQIRLFDSAVSN